MDGDEKRTIKIDWVNLKTFKIGDFFYPDFRYWLIWGGRAGFFKFAILMKPGFLPSGSIMLSYPLSVKSFLTENLTAHPRTFKPSPSTVCALGPLFHEEKSKIMGGTLPEKDPHNGR